MASEPRRGTQAVERAALILRELGSRGAAGWGLWDLADLCGLDRGTTHRILGGLVRERLVAQRESDRRYLLGPLLFELSVTETWYERFQDAARASVRRIARHSPDTVALCYLRSHDDVVCIAREGASSYTHNGTGIRIGQRLPLLSLAGGSAILASLAPKESSQIVERNAERLRSLGHARIARMRDFVRQASGAEHVFAQDVFWEGVSSVSMPVFGASGAPIGSLVCSRASVELRRNAALALLEEVRPAVDALAVAAQRWLTAPAARDAVRK